MTESSPLWKRHAALCVFLICATIALFSGGVFAAEPESTAPITRDGAPWSLVNVLRGFLGLATLIGLAWILSFNKKAFPVRVVAGAVGLQLVLGLLLIKWDIGYSFFEAISTVFVKLLGFTTEGSVLVFGDLVTNPTQNRPALAFQALPTIIFFSCLMSVLYHLRVMHALIWVLAQIMNRALGVTGAESMAMGANVFVGQTEAPLVIRRFIPTMTQSEIMSLMVGGFATIAGSVLAAYIKFLEDAGGADFVPHLLIASVMSAPAAFAIAKIILPETEESETGKGMSMTFKPVNDNVLDAAAAGTSDGLKLWMNVFAMLLAFTAMVAFINWPLEALGDWILEGPIREQIGMAVDLKIGLDTIFGLVFAPLAFMMGVEGADCIRFGGLLGMKIGLNEFLAYLELTQQVALFNAGEAGAMSKRSLFMATYALCGFANFASIGIQLGGITPLAPERRKEIIKLVLRAMLGGALASWMTASIAGMFF
ncbi:MAG: nucleoside transporter C-terminal domain-containing protein [Planctomycetota bacterium]